MSICALTIFYHYLLFDWIIFKFIIAFMDCLTNIMNTRELNSNI